MPRISLSSDDEDFPSLRDLLVRPATEKPRDKPRSTKPPEILGSGDALPSNITPDSAVPSTIRRQRLGPRYDQANPLFQRFTARDLDGNVEAIELPNDHKQSKEERVVSGRTSRAGTKKAIQIRYNEDSARGKTSEREADRLGARVSMSSGSDTDGVTRSGRQPRPLRRDAEPTNAIATGPTTPTKPKVKGAVLVSPTKQQMTGIPKTPHRPSLDVFWSQEFVDNWNEEHSPVKKLALTSPEKSPARKNILTQETCNKSPAKSISERQIKKTFEAKKHAIAEAFLRELDVTITQGKLGELAGSTGGIKLNWTNKLNTTAGRANWKRETVRTKTPSGEVDQRHKHHASIDLAEKVIDDEERLLNVIAHEFCHLANFMVSGVTGNPHGKEFKAWAARCSKTFGHRGIQVTTKHTFDIDFKYVWQCTSCTTEFKRHSKSINPDRHRCGSCKSQLEQIKPKPRAQGATSEYHKFMREQMKLIKEENPGSPQKDIMRIVAERWARQNPRKAEATKLSSGGPKVDEVANQLDKLHM